MSGAAHNPRTHLKPIHELRESCLDCVACCEQRNKAKRKMSIVELRGWITWIYKHYVEGGAECPF